MRKDKMIEWIETPESSNVLKFGYDEEFNKLMVEFKNGNMYEYFDVPVLIYESMKSASSKGKFLAQEIKGNYRYSRR
jgi:hypothetical protein